MDITVEEIRILNKLIGAIDEKTASAMKQTVDFFLHPQVSLFIPSSGQCEYAVTPSHTHPAYTFIYYFQSVDNFIIEGRNISYDLSDGKCLTAVSPEIKHQECVEEYFQSYIAIAVDKELFERILILYGNDIPVFRGEIFTPHPELLGLLRCFMLETGNITKHNNDLIDSLALVITHYLIRCIITDKVQPVTLYDRFEVDKAISYMNSHFKEKITLEELAVMVHLSASHFTKIFKAITGETPIDFLHMLRLQKAKNMLMKYHGNITDIAIECGFNSSSYFSTCFFEKYKMTPSIYRKNFRKTENR